MIKRRFYIFLYAALFMVFLPLMLLAQDVGPGFSIPESFLSIPALVAAVLFLTELFKNVTDKKTQYVSWIIAIVLGFIGSTFHLGIFNAVTWWVGLVYSLSSALIANGLATWELIKTILDFLKLSPASRS